jgi:hypothetical protein
MDEPLIYLIEDFMSCPAIAAAGDLEFEFHDDWIKNIDHLINVDKYNFHFLNLLSFLNCFFTWLHSLGIPLFVSNCNSRWSKIPQLGWREVFRQRWTGFLRSWRSQSWRGPPILLITFKHGYIEFHGTINVGYNRDIVIREKFMWKNFGTTELRRYWFKNQLPDDFLLMSQNLSNSRPLVPKFVCNENKTLKLNWLWVRYNLCLLFKLCMAVIPKSHWVRHICYRHKKVGAGSRNCQ